MKNSNYKKIYSENMNGLKWNSELYEIHHIDLNHNNNDFKNLILVPRKLHKLFHFLYNSVKVFDFSSLNQLNYQEPISLTYISKFFIIKQDMNKFLRLKEELLSTLVVAAYLPLKPGEDFDDILSVCDSELYSKYISAYGDKNVR